MTWILGSGLRCPEEVSALSDGCSHTTYGLLGGSGTFSAEEEDQLHNQNDDNRQLQQEGAALIELIHHEPVEIFRDMDLRRDDIPVIRDADPCGSQSIQTCGKHIAQKLDGVIDAFGQL